MKKIILISVIFTVILSFLTVPLSGADANTDETNSKGTVYFDLNCGEIPHKGGTFTATVDVKSNFGFYSEIVYIFYPDCLTVDNVEPVLPSSTFADDSPFFSSKDVITATNNSKTVSSRIISVTESTGFSLEVGAIEDFIASGYKYSVLYMTSEQTLTQSGEKKSYMNFKPVDGALAHYTFSYDASKNAENKTRLPIYVVPSNIDSFYIDTESQNHSVNPFCPYGTVCYARTTSKHLYVESISVAEGCKTADISVFANYISAHDVVKGSLELPSTTSVINVTSANGVIYSLNGNILNFTSNREIFNDFGESELLRITLDTENLSLGAYPVKFSSSILNDTEIPNNEGCLTVEKACPAGECHLYAKSRAKATCTKDGYILYTCVKCGYTDKSDVTNAFGHTLETDSKTNPTCTNFGTTVLKCTVCGYTEYFYEDPLVHNYLFTDKTVSSCLEHSKNNYKCELCGDTYSVILTEYGEHSCGTVLVQTKPTCTEKGTLVAQCSLCNAVFSKDNEPTGHSYVLTEHKEATVSEAGYNTYICENCYDVYTEPIERLQLLGDVNGDGILTLNDYKILKKYVINVISADELILANADISGDDVISTKDLKLLRTLSAMK